MKRGFTLIEILIVVAIIGLLSSVVLVGLGGFRSRGRDVRRLADLRESQNGLELYYTKYQQYPSVNSWSELRRIIVEAEIGVSEMPKDPSSPKTEYHYGVSSDGNSYVVGADLESENAILNESVKGSIYGVNCTGQVYCIKF